MNQTTSNDITGDMVMTKATNQKYREGYDRIFNKEKAMPKKSARDIKQDYQCIGTANSITFKRPEGKWVRFAMNSRGTHESWCCHDLKMFYHVYCD